MGWINNKHDGVHTDGYGTNKDDGVVPADADDAGYRTNIDPNTIGPNDPRPSAHKPVGALGGGFSAVPKVPA